MNFVEGQPAGFGKDRQTMVSGLAVTAIALIRVIVFLIHTRK